MLIMIAFLSISLNVVFWAFPDQYFSMKFIHFSKNNDEQMRELMRFKSIHRDLISFQKFLMICVLISILGVFLASIFQVEAMIIFTCVLMFVIPFSFNCFKLIKAWKLFMEFRGHDT